MGQPDLDEKQRDELQELGNVGAGRASRYLSDVVDDKVDIDIPEVDVVKFSGDVGEEIAKVFDVPENQQLMSVLIPTSKPAGGIVFSFTQQDYMTFLQMSSDGGEQDDFLEISEEVGDFYLKAVHQLLGIEVDHDEPRLISLPLNTLLIQIQSSIVGQGGGSSALVINTDFSIQDQTQGELTLFLEVNDVDTIINALEQQIS
ncbi:MAG: hypothetical protein SVS85_02495 [Candidatus Nanohaloarchaea archaeon]|nr:hypothetical protein [Candidatus Nanohaloarchaea archaeon]